VPLRVAPKGAYTVRWHAMSADGHVVSGVFTYGVRVAAPPPTEAAGASGPTTAEHVVRWLYFLGLALLVGGLGFRLLVLGRGPAPRALDRRFYLAAGLGAVVVLEVGIAAFILRAEDALQLPFERLLYGDLSPIAGGTRFGQAFIAMELGFAFVLAFLYLAWLTERTWLLWPAFLLGLGVASGLSLSGHAATTSSAAELADWVHLAAAMLWIGGLVQLVAVVWPAAPQLRRGAFLRFSRYATMLVAVLLAAGIYLSVLRLPRLADLWEASYGQVLLVKLALVALALAWGGAHRVLVRPRLERVGSDRFVARLSRSLAGESAVATSILLVAAILVDSKPPL
jgi:copper transport protein